METLPLFPLNTVLFPGMPISLHIFEERYKVMINRCIDTRTPFGVVLLQSGSEVQEGGSSAIPYSIGCTAYITQVQRLSQGRMNLIAVGADRFQIVNLSYAELYLTGNVEYLELTNLDTPALADRSHRLRHWIDRYLSSIAKVENISFDRDQLPDDTLQLAYLAATLLRVPNVDKQQLLIINDALTLVERILSLYRKEMAILQVLLSQNTLIAEKQIGVFSAN